MKQYELKSGLFDRTRMLTIEPDVIRYDEFDLKSRGYNEMLKPEITDFKYIANLFGGISLPLDESIPYA